MSGNGTNEACQKRDILDDETLRIRGASELEAQLEKRPNTIVEAHPHLIGYAFLGCSVVLASAPHLRVFVMSFLFLYLISDFMTNDVRKFVPFLPRALLFSVLYVVVITLITLLSYKGVPSLVKHLPEFVNQMQVKTVKQFKLANHEWNLTQYVDMEAVRAAIVRAGASVLSFIMDSLTPLYKGFVQFLFALVINVFFYHDTERIRRVLNRRPGSMMSFLYNFTEVRVRIFYCYFKRVMGGQLIISAINTFISAPVIILLHLPHPLFLIFAVFFCGLFPVVGNLVSNTLILINAFASSGLWGSGVCLILLITVHKLEYFLNSRIIGGIARLPMTISLAALIICEVLFGISGLILAIPLVLFVRHELEHVPALAPAHPLAEIAADRPPAIEETSS